MKSGLLIPSIGYDSANIRPQIALDRDPPHLDLLNMSGGTALASGASPVTLTETLFTMEHHLLYKPKVLVYFYTDFYSSTDVGYGLGTLVYALAGAYYDRVTYAVTDTTFSIVHILSDIAGVSYTSTAPSKKLRIKYMIFSIPEDKRICDV